MLPRSYIADLVSIGLVLLPITTLFAQRIAIQKPPYYVGEPVVVQVVVSGLDSSQPPNCRFAGPPQQALQVAGPQVSTNSFTQTQIINGRMSRTESHDYKFTFQITATAPGSYAIGPFELEVNGEVEQLEEFSIEFEELDDDPDVQIEIALERETIYVGQEVPVTIRWGFSGDIRATNHAFDTLQIRSPLFDQFDFKEEPPTTRQTLTLATAQGTVLVDGKVSKSTRDGKEFIVVTGRRTLIAQSPGVYENIPVTCRTEKVTQWRRNFFGDLSPADTAPAVASGEPLNFTIKPIPTNGRPASFAGAVGQGYSVDVSANRSVVRVGDPISLDIKLRGDGNIQNLSLPKLDALPGFDTALFQLPSETPSGTFTGNEKQFKVNIRVKDESVDQIPEIAFSWFDPTRETFQTTHSKPIALQVMPAQLITSAEVVSAVGGVEGSQPASAESRAQPLSLVGANLAVTKDLELLTSSGSSMMQAAWVPAALYALGIGMVVVAWVIQRRSQRDPGELERQRVRRSMQHELKLARQMPVAQAMQKTAAELRSLLPLADVSHRHSIDALTAECDRIRYAQSPQDHQQSAWQCVSRAENILDEVTQR